MCMARGDQRRDPLIALRIPEALDQRLRAHAANTGSTLSEVVRGAIETSLATSTPRIRRVAVTTPSTTAIVKAGQCEHRVRAGNYCRRCERIV